MKSIRTCCAVLLLLLLLLQVGPGFVVAQASEHKSETLAKT
jgi:hypothetical protein